MLKKILYAIVVIVIIVILGIMWKDSKKLDEAPILPQGNQMNQVQNDTPQDINKDIDNINVDSGIDADMNTIDADIKTL